MTFSYVFDTINIDKGVLSMNERLQNILREIESGTRKYILDLTLTEDDLLAKDNNGITFLEHLIKNKISLFNINDIINNNIEIAYIISKESKSLYLFDFTENTLFSNFNGKRLIDYILEAKKISGSMVENIKNNIEIIDLLISTNNIYKLSYLSSEIIQKLITKDEKGIYPIEKYINDEKILKDIIPKVNDKNALLEICNKYNNYELLKYANTNILMSNYEQNTILHFLINQKNIIPNKLNNVPDNKDFVNFLMENSLYEYLQKTRESTLLLEILPSKTLLEFLIEKGYNPDLKHIFDKKTIQVLYKCKRLDLIQQIGDSILLTPAKEILNNDNIKEETFIEYMLDNNYNNIGTNFSNKEIIKILYKRERLDLLVNASENSLLETIENDNNYTYLDYILDSIINGKVKKSVKELKPYDNKAKFYVIVAKHNMMAYVNNLTEEELLKEKNGMTLLEELLNIDSNLTVNTILSGKVKSNPQIALILKSKGFEQKNINISNEKNENITNYIESINNNLGIGPFNQEGEMLLKELTSLFLSDGKSDKELISALVSGYRHSLLINYQVNIEELRRLIEVKKNNLDKFYYIKEENSGYFSSKTGSVHCGNAIVETILHETGHALHYYLAQDIVPDEYQEIIYRASQNPEILKKVKEYSDKCFKLEDKIQELVETEYKSLFERYYTEEKKEEIKRILAKSKEEKIEEYSKLGISKEQLDIILNEMYTEEEYIAHQKRIFIKEKEDAIMRSEYGSLIAIGDILDAIYEGKLRGKGLKNNQGENVRVLYGHGISYYYATKHGFDEMIANFASISKSNDSEKMLKLLKETVGEEVYNMISNFYYENIVGLTLEEKQTKKVGGR